MKTALVGYTGFVGSNLCESFDFDGLYNSTSITEAYGSQPELLIYAGVPSEMFLANSDPDADRERILLAKRNIDAIRPKRLVLISTVAVYENPVGVDENTPTGKGGFAYGKNRRLLESLVSESVDECLVVRLPALFGKNLKKNFLYDYIHLIPSMLTQEKFAELVAVHAPLADCYFRQPNGFFRCRSLSPRERAELKAVFSCIGFNALNFTDSRSVYQFYDLKLLWRHIQTALENRLPVLNLTSAPVSAAELYGFLCGGSFENHLAKDPLHYNVKTVHCPLFGGSDGYILSKTEELESIKAFVSSYDNDM